MTKIVLRVIGGLGNQLFAYAAARRLALANDAELVLDSVTGFANDHVYRRTYQLDHFAISCRLADASERLEPFGRVRRYLKRAIGLRRPFGRRRYIHQYDMNFDPRMLAIKPRGTLFLEGYWQSEQYFLDTEDVIRRDLQITPPRDLTNLAMADAIAHGPAVAVHVRFFEAPSEPRADNAPDDYYARAVARMEELVPGAHYFVFSDQPEAARSRIPLPDDRLTLVSHNRGDASAYADLWLMQQCEHFIIANSTFSWWGAWLSTHSGKHVIAPGYKGRVRTMSWGFDGLLPDRWIKL